MAVFALIVLVQIREHTPVILFEWREENGHAGEIKR